MLLKVVGLSKHFGGLKAVNELSYHVEQGEILAIIGPNGAGKTTLYNLVCGMIKPTAGNITLLGESGDDSGSTVFREEDITGLKPYQVSRRGIARTFQITTLFDQLRVIDNLAIGYRSQTRTGFWDALFRNSRWKEDREKTITRALEVAGIIGLGDKVFDFVSTLPQEAQKRLSIGIALAGKPRLLLLDEPTAGVNPEETSGITELIKKIKDEGTTVCLIEHKMRMVMGLADRIVALNYGRKIAEGTPTEVCNDEEVIKAYLGGERIA